jgi:type VI secretion system secreted protein VgrG
LWTLHTPLPPRDFCTQFEETDLELVRRLTAEAGIFFYFLQPVVPSEVVSTIMLADHPVANAVRDGVAPAAPVPAVDGEVLVFADSASYPSVGDFPTGLEQLVQAGLAQIDQLTHGALSTVQNVVAQAAPLTEALGGPDLTRLMQPGTSRPLHFRPDADSLTQGRDAVTTFQLRDAVRFDHAQYRIFDPRRPLAELAYAHSSRDGAQKLVDLPTEAESALSSMSSLGAASSPSVARVLGSLWGHHDHEHYEHHDAFLWPNWDYAASEPRRMLESDRRDRRIAEGTSPCPTLACGARFLLDEHPVGWVNREYALIEVEHRGHAHRGPDHQGADRVYENRFRCVPADAAYLPQRPERRTVQTCLTAIVIGTTEQSDLHTQRMGEVQVRFHWDREQRGTCWIRTMQSWSGAGWGVQFMPRIGMEVVVGFDGGDPDKPIVLGCVYNGTHPPPFSLPDDQTKSGIRTQSTPGDGGHNEVSFEDRRGLEQVYMRAERNLDIDVLHDRTLDVQHDDTTRVHRNQTVEVAHEQHVEVRGGQTVRATPSRRVEVDGTHEVATRGDLIESVSGEAHSHVEGASDRTVGGGSRERITGDALRQIRGNVVELVGSHEAPKSRAVRVEGKSELSAASLNEIVSDEELVLRVGHSFIRISSEQIEVHSPKVLVRAKDASAELADGHATVLANDNLTAIANQVILKSSGASLGLSSEASLAGSKVLLNSPENASDAVDANTPEPTVIEMVDQHGARMAYERYQITLDDGSSVSGVLDAEGRAVVVLPSGGEITFPDLAEVEAQ